MKKKNCSLFLAIVFIISSFSAFASPVSAGAAQSVIISGQDVANGQSVDGVTFTAAEGETPATLTLETATIQSDGDGGRGIQISGFADFRIVVSGENTINIGGHGSIGILMEGGNLTIYGDESTDNLNITSETGIRMDGWGDPRTLTFTGFVTADISNLFLEPVGTEARFEDNVNVTLHQSESDLMGRFTETDSAIVTFDDPGGDPPGQSVIISGQDVANGQSVDGVTFTAAEGEIPATLTLNGLICAGTAYGEGEGAGVAGIQIDGFDNFRIVVSGTNSIDASTGHGSVGILMRGGDLTIEGDGAITVTGNDGIWMDGFDSAKTLTFNGSLTAEINYLRLEPNSEGNQTTAAFKEYVNVTLHQPQSDLTGRFTKADTATVTFDDLGGEPAQSVIISGQDVANGQSVDGVTFTAAEGEIPATLTLNGLICAGTAYGEGEGAGVAGIQIDGFDNFRIVVSGTNSIDASTGHGSVGILMRGGDLTIEGDGAITVTGNDGIWMDGFDSAKTLTFNGSLTAEINYLRLEPNSEGNQTTAAFNEYVNVTLHQSESDLTGRFTKADTATVTFDDLGGGEPAQSVIISGQDVANGQSVDGVTFTAAEGETPATLTLNGLICAGTAYGEGEGAGVAGIQIYGFDNFRIVVSGTNSIDASTGHGSVGILMRGGDLTIEGDGAITVTGNDGIWMDGFDSAKTLTFNGSLTAEINYLRLEPNSEGNQTTAAFNEYVNVTLHQSESDLTGRFTETDSAIVTFDDPGGDPPAQSVIISGQDVANGQSVDGVTFTAAEGEIPATLTLNGLICAGTAYGEGEGAGVAGIRIYGFDNFRIVVSGTNSIDASTGHGSVGILMRSGTLTIEGDGTLNVTGESGIWMDCMPTARTLTFNGVVTADISRLRLEPNSEGNQTTAAFNDNVNVTLHQSESDLTGRFTKAGTATVTFAPGGGDPPGGDGYDPSQPSVFRFGADECTADPDDFEGITSEQIVDFGTGWEVNALPPDPADPVSSVGFGVTLIDYNAGPIYIDNWDGFLSMDGDINIGANLDGYSFECHNSNIQFWGLPGPDSEIGAVSMAGGILIDNTEFGSMVYDQWQIGTADQKSPVGITGMNYAELVLNGDIFTIYTEGDAVSGMTEVWVRDEAQFVAYADGEGIDQVGSLYALTGSSFEIHYGLGESVEPVLDETVNHMIMYLEPKPEQLDEVFPEPIKYYGDANTNTLIYWVDERPEYFQEAVSIPELQRKYVLTDEEMDTGRRYYFESTASRMTRVHADDDGSMEGGTILVRAANGYNDGGYVVEAGSTVRVEILPDAGYQYKSGTLLAGNDAPIALTATADPAIYTYIMPDSTMAVGCEFELKSDQVVANSESIDSATAIIPAGTIQNGNALFKVEDSEMTDEELATSLNGIEDIEVGAALDLTLNQMITKDGSAVDPWLTPITELDNAMTVSLTVDEEIQGMTGYRVFRIHEGVTDEIDVTYTDGVLSFDTDRFSTYILGYALTPTPPPTPTPTPPPTPTPTPPPTPTPTPPPTPTPTPPPSATVRYRTHVQDVGWQGYVSNGALSGTSGQSKRLEAINIKLEGVSGGIEYRTHVQDIGWQGFVANNALSGTSGQSKRLEAIQIRLTGEAANLYDVYYRVHAQDTGWLDWAKNGASSGTAGYSRRLEAIEIKLVAKGGAAPGATTRPFIQNGEPIPSTGGSVLYKTHVQDVGWQAYVSDGAASGTSGQSKRLEGIQIKLNNIAGGIEYSTHIQDIGWQGFVANDAMSGTSGQSKRLEAIKIRLTGAAAEAYDVYYCVHAQDTGWLDWAKNGEAAGTAGFSYRLEAIKIVLVPKGAPAPGPTARAFVQG